MAYIQNVELSYDVWKALEQSASYSGDTVYYLDSGLQYNPFFVDSLNYFVFYTNINRDPSSKNQLLSGAKASKTIQDITYTANAVGTAGNSITIAYINDAVAVGQEYVTVAGNAISVHIVSGASTAQQVVTAVTAWSAYNGNINRSAASAELVSAVVSGSTGKAQVTVGATALLGGIAAVTVLADFTATYLGTATLVKSYMDGLADDLI